MAKDEPEDAEALAEERRRLRELRLTVDLACNVIAQGRIGRAEAEALAAATRRRALKLFPGKGDTFDLILAPRLTRLIDEFCVQPSCRARVLPFGKS